MIWTRSSDSVQHLDASGDGGLAANQPPVFPAQQLRIQPDAVE